MLLSAVDLMMVSSLGTKAISAVGIFSQPKMAVLCFARSLAIAVTALVATRVGQRQEHTLSRCLKQSLIIMLPLAVLLLAATEIWLEPILRAAGAQPDYLTEAISYGRICMIGLFLLGISIIIHGALAGIGQTRVMMVTNVLGNGINIAANFWLIPRYGVTGAAVGTLLGNIVTVLLSLMVVVQKNHRLSLWGRSDWRFQRSELAYLFSNGSSAFVEQGFERVGMFLYSSMTAQLGMTAFAAHHLCMTLCDVYYYIGQGLSKASLVAAGQSLGAKNRRAFNEMTVFAQRLGLVLSIVAFAGYILLRRPMLMVFSPTMEVLALGQQIMIFVAVCSFAQTQSLICLGILRGAGWMRYIAIYSLISIALIRPSMTYWLCFSVGWGIYGAWTALMLDQSLRMICASLGVWQIKRALSYP